MEKNQFISQVERVSNLTKPKTNKLLRVFTGVHLGNSHAGLAKLAAEVKINVTDLDLGEYVVFVNRKRNAVKMFAPGNIVAHMKLPSNMVVDMRVLSLIPRFFNGGKINYQGALKEFLKKEFPKAEVHLN